MGKTMGVHHYAALFLLSMATLLLELSLTRVLSVMLWYYFGFLVISTALLGFGIAGTVLAVWGGLRERYPLDAALAWIGVLFGILTVGCFWLMQRVPFDPLNLISDRRQWFFIPLFYLILTIPFFCSGLAVGLLLTRGGHFIHRLYACDMVGAGVGCAAIAVVMPGFGGAGSVVVAALLGFSSAALFGAVRARVAASVALVLCAAAGVLTIYSSRALPIAVTSAKLRLPWKPIYTGWNTFSRIDVFESRARPKFDVPARRVILYDAGTAATGILDLRPNVRDYLANHKDDSDYSSAAAYLGRHRSSVLIIGSGAGSQVLDALHFGASRITAVEVNPIINNVVSGHMSGFWGGLFRQPQVHLVTAEARSYVRRSHDQFDAIISFHTISNAAVASGALALSEDYVLTREAFEDYFRHLSPDGILYFTRPEAQIPRLFATAREAMASTGARDFPLHFYAYRYPPDNWDKRAFGPDRPSFDAGFLVKKSPFTSLDIRMIEAYLGVGRTTGNSSSPAPETLYSPFEDAPENIYERLLTAPNLDRVYRSQAAELRPTTDDRPFFNHNTRWSSINAGTIRALFTEKHMGEMVLGDKPIAEVSLAVLLLQSAVIAGILILPPFRRLFRLEHSNASPWRLLIYFAALGLGFILVEMALLSRFVLFLGEPVYTYAVVLASLLTFTGLGSHFASRLGKAAHPATTRALLLLLPVLAATTVAVPWLFSVALGWPLSCRIALSIAALAPLGILMGMPFPTGLRIVREHSPALLPWVWGVNGFFTVIGTVLALIFGMSFGFNFVLFVGGCSYLLALGAMQRRKGSKSGEAW